jgi:hypothetical protein
MGDKVLRENFQPRRRGRGTWRNVKDKNIYGWYFSK